MLFSGLEAKNRISDIHRLFHILHHFLSPILSTVCNCDLARSGFFQKKGEYICTADYQRLYGTRCDRCDSFITGEVVSALGRTYHPKCFVCSVCRYPGTITNTHSLVSLCGGCVWSTDPPDAGNVPRCKHVNNILYILIRKWNSPQKINTIIFSEFCYQLGTKVSVHVKTLVVDILPIFLATDLIPQIN